MTTIILGKLKQWTPVVHVAILSCGTVLSFIISYFLGYINLYLPFISETGAYSPAQCIFSLFLIIGSFVGCLMVFLMYLALSSTSENLFKPHMHLITSIIGINANLGLSGVAAFPMTTVFWAHLVAATVYFGGNALYFFFISYISLKIYGQSRIVKIRFGLSVAIAVFLVLISIIFPISLRRWQDTQDIIPALKEPKHEGFDLLLISSILEWSIVFVIIAFDITFMYELKYKEVVITIQPEEDEKPPEATTADSPEIEEGALPLNES